MKKVKFQFLYYAKDETMEGYLLEDHDDIKKLKSYLAKAEERVMTKFIKSGESPSRFNHLLYGMRPIDSALATLATTKAYLDERNPIYLLEESSAAFLSTAIAGLHRQGQVLMNSNGSMTPLSAVNIIEKEDVDQFPRIEPMSYLSENSKVINLENDPYLEIEAIKYMKTRWGHKYSWIKEMILADKRDFIRTFQKFKDQGGESVYVYTTGMDIKQMYDYTECALQVGLQHFVFQFVVGMSPGIKEFVESLKTKAKVEIV